MGGEEKTMRGIVKSHYSAALRPRRIVSSMSIIFIISILAGTKQLLQVEEILTI